jgi:hypothetical protein
MKIMRGYLKKIFQPLPFLIFENILSAKQWRKLQYLRQHLSSKERGLMDGTKGHSFIYKFQI